MGQADTAKLRHGSVWLQRIGGTEVQLALLRPPRAACLPSCPSSSRASALAATGVVSPQTSRSQPAAKSSTHRPRRRALQSLRVRRCGCGRRARPPWTTRRRWPAPLLCAAVNHQETTKTKTTKKSTKKTTKTTKKKQKQQKQQLEAPSGRRRQRASLRQERTKEREQTTDESERENARACVKEMKKRRPRGRLKFQKINANFF